MDTERRQKRLCLAIMILSVLMQVAAIRLAPYLASLGGSEDSSFERETPELTDWPSPGH